MSSLTSVELNGYEFRLNFDDELEEEPVVSIIVEPIKVAIVRKRLAKMVNKQANK